MRLFITVLALSAFAISSVATNGPAQATTYDLPLDGTISIDDNGLAGQTPIEIQAVEGFSLPVFNQQSPQTTVGVYQWIANFSVLDQNGTPVSEPSLSPFGTALTGYGQNCSTRPYCPSPSGPSSETILSGTLFISGDATLDISTIISGENIVSDNLELLLTLPDGFTTLSATPLPAALPLFATGLGLVALLSWRKRRRPKLAV